MLQTITSALIQKPLNILAFAAALAACWALLRFGAALGARRPNALLAPVVGSILYASWEWLVMTRTPEANIRVDLLVIWPALFFLTVWSLFRAFR